MLSAFDIILTLFYLLIALFVIKIFPFFHLKGLPKNFSLIAFLVKIIAGFGLTYIYTSFYEDRSQADIFKFFDDSKYLHQVFYEKPGDFFTMLFGFDNNAPYYDQYYYQMDNWFKVYDPGWFNDTRTMIRLNAFIRLISFGVYHVHTIIFSFIAFSGLVLIYKACLRWFQQKEMLLAVSLFLMPSMLCWTSGILKETVLFLGLGLFLSNVFHLIHHQQNIKKWIFLLLGIFLLIVVKPYIILALLPGLAAFLLHRKFSNLNPLWFYSGISVMGILFFYVIAQINPAYNILVQLSERQQSVWRLAYYVDSGSLIDAEPLNPNIFSFLRNLPEALVNSAFRPGILDAKNALQWLAALENLGIIITLMFAVGLFNYEKKYLSFFLFLLMFVLIVYSLIGLTTPVLGTLVRYRVPALPFYMMLCFLMIDYERLKRILNETFAKIE